jgi:hypothetical protein
MTTGILKMFSIVTPCGRRVLFSDSDWDKIENIVVYYEQEHRLLVYKVKTDKKLRGSVLSYLFDTSNSQKFGYLYADGNRFNLQRENVTQIDRSTSFRYRPAPSGKKYKGVRCRTNSRKHKRWFASLHITQNCYFEIPCNNEIHAAAMYNAVCDYLKLEGYRNDVPKIELTNELQKYIDTKLQKWGMKCA